jgi:holin-like protein
MVFAFTILIGCQLLGEILRQALHLPVPGPVIGMALLTACLVARAPRGARDDAETARDTPLARLAGGLIGSMGLLFVPAGVGIISEGALLRREWLPILAGVVVSTLSGLLVTGYLMDRLSRRAEPHDAAPPGVPAGGGQRS